MAGKIIVVGSLNMDLVACAARIPVAGETITGHTFFDGAAAQARRASESTS
jgi:sugar/nucleoside kinase (ribokinase family)